MVQVIERRIYLIRGHKVMIDEDLAELYDEPTKRFNQQVRRNPKRFPKDFMFQLTKAEAEALRSQFATSKTGRGGRRYLPYAFTSVFDFDSLIFVSGWVSALILSDDTRDKYLRSAESSPVLQIESQR